MCVIHLQQYFTNYQSDFNTLQSQNICYLYCISQRLYHFNIAVNAAIATDLWTLDYPHLQICSLFYYLSLHAAFDKSVICETLSS